MKTAILVSIRIVYNISILEGPRIVQFRYVQELSEYTISVPVFIPELLLYFWDIQELSVIYFPAS